MNAATSRPPIDQTAWQPWLDQVAAGLGVDATGVDVAAIHELTGQVAQRADRPLAPLAAHLWGIARAEQPQADPARLSQMLVERAES